MLGGAAAGLELGEPKLAATGGLGGFGNVRLQVGDAGVGRFAVPVDGEEIDRALGAARGQEVAQPVQAFVRVVAVAHCRRAQFGFARVRLQVCHPVLGSILRGQISLGRDVGFVEAEQVRRSTRERLVCVFFPVRCVHLNRTPELRHEVEGRGNVTARLGVPVVSPRNGRRVGEEVGQGGRVVDETALSARVG